MEIVCWGSRGSCPGFSSEKAKYGGNTTCLSIQTREDAILIIDAGTGIRQLGNWLASQSMDVYLLLTHVHWDHIQGFPFFLPLMQPGRNIHIYSPMGETIISHLTGQLDGVKFPIKFEDLHSNIIIEKNTLFLKKRFDLSLDFFKTNHPGDCLGFKFCKGDKSLVFIPDNQLHSKGDADTAFKNTVAFAQNASVLIHDAQYLPSDMPCKRNWGHSQVSEVQECAYQANVEQLYFFHHDPARTDKEIDAYVRSSKKWFKSKQSTIRCAAAYDGMRLKF